MDLLDWFFSFSTAHNFNFGFSNEVSLTSAFDTKGTPGLKLPYLHSTDGIQGGGLTRDDPVHGVGL
jgi:hypothetical protein